MCSECVFSQKKSKICRESSKYVRILACHAGNIVILFNLSEIECKRTNYFFKKETKLVVSVPESSRIPSILAQIPIILVNSTGM